MRERINEYISTVDTFVKCLQSVTTVANQNSTMDLTGGQLRHVASMRIHLFQLQ